MIYKSARINADTFKLVAQDEKFDITQDNYRKVTDLKRRYPGLRVLLSVGNNDDDPEQKEKYLTLVS